MVRRIWVVVDGAEASQAAVTMAVEMVRQGMGTLTGLFVIDSQWPDFIGNDWQSSRGSRQGFLDHVHAEQQDQAGLARQQFETATAGIPDCHFEVMAGDPIETLLKCLNHPDTDLLMVGRRTFQVSGRPRLKRLARELAEGARRPLLLFP
ncbi:Universal stress protein [Gammaproteobacteria bacterium]